MSSLGPRPDGRNARSSRRSGAFVTVVTVVMMSAASCASSGDDATRRPVLVFAAASFAAALADAEVAFEERVADIDVQVNVAGSSALRVQILEGAPADVFVSADESNMADVIAAGAAETSKPFARNSMQIAVPIGNPGGVEGLDDFANPDLLIGLCAPGVPCGDFARTVLANAGVEPSLDTNEADVRALVTKIAADELDAGIVYASDVAGADDVVGIDIADEVNVQTVAPIAVLSGSPEPAAAETFVEFLLSPDGRAIVVANGFMP